MPVLTFPVQADGLLVDAMIGLDRSELQALIAAGQPLPVPLLIRGVIDTGADVTAVAPSILARLGVPPGKTVQTHTAGGPVNTSIYDVSFSIPAIRKRMAPFVVPQLTVTELKHSPPNIDVLIGLDVLLQCHFHLDGPARQFSLSF